MNTAQLTAIQVADAELNNAVMLNYSELLAVAQSVLGIAIWHGVVGSVADAHELERCRIALAPMAEFSEEAA